MIRQFDHISGQYFAIGNAKIYYEEVGKGDKPVMLLLHGGFGSIEDFNLIVSLLEKEFRIIGVDSRGQGKSTLGTQVLSYEVIQSDIEILLSHLSIEELNVIGISDGGIVAYRLASFSRLKINKLITIGSRWHSNNATDTKDILGAVTADSWKKKFPSSVALYERLNPKADWERLAEQVVNMWLNERSYPNENVKNISADTLIIRGDRDHLTKRKFVCELADQLKKSSLSNIAFAGHVVYTEEPEILMRTINKFLGQ